MEGKGGEQRRGGEERRRGEEGGERGWRTITTPTAVGSGTVKKEDLASLRPAVNWPTRTAALYLESFQYTARQVSFFSKKLLPLLFSLHVELHLTKSVLAYGLNIFFLLE